MTAVSESRDIAVQMSTLVQTLLSLARQTAGVNLPGKSESVDLSLVIADVLASLKLDRGSLHIRIDQELEGNAIAATDPANTRAWCFAICWRMRSSTHPLKVILSSGPITRWLAVAR